VVEEGRPRDPGPAADERPGKNVPVETI